jgi:ribonuclease-3
MAPLSRETRAALEKTLGHAFHDPELLELALWHPSYAHEVDGSRGNERLEFIGDAVLDLVVAELLYAAHPHWHEGDLTRVRASLVNTESLAALARGLALPPHLKLGRTERKSGGSQKNSILASLLEAILGATYLDGGLEPIRGLVRRAFASSLEADFVPPPADPKTRFQEWAHAALQGTPGYRTLSDSGVENAEDRFEVEVSVDGQSYGRGTGRNKRAAERSAAQAALARIHEL